MIRATSSNVQFVEINDVEYRFQALQFHSDGMFQNTVCQMLFWGKFLTNGSHWPFNCFGRVYPSKNRSCYL